MQSTLTLKKSLFYIAGSVLVLRLFLDLDYLRFIGPIYGYQNMGLSPDSSRYIESWVALLLVTPFFTNRIHRLSKSISFVLFLLGYVPLTSYYALSGFDLSWLALCSLFWIIVSIVGDLQLRAPPLPRARTMMPLLLISAALAAISVGAVIITFGFSLKLSLTDVYEIRAENEISAIPLGGYIVPWTARVALPALMLLGLRMRGASGTALLGASALMEIILFSLTGHKSYLFSIPLIVGLYVISSRKDRILLIAIGCVSVVGGSLLVDYLVSGGWFSAIIVRRVFFVPAMLSTAYFEFFQGRPMLLSHSILSPVFSNPLGMSPSRAVGEIYLGFPDMNANNGVMADGFMNFGVIGMLIWAVLTGLTISCFDAICSSVDRRIGFVLGVNSIRAFINSGLTSSLLTHGIIFTILLMALIPKRSLHAYRAIHKKR